MQKLAWETEPVEERNGEMLTHIIVQLYKKGDPFLKTYSSILYSFVVPEMLVKLW